MTGKKTDNVTEYKPPLAHQDVYKPPHAQQDVWPILKSQSSSGISVGSPTPSPKQEHSQQFPEKGKKKGSAVQNVSPMSLSPGGTGTERTVSPIFERREPSRQPAIKEESNSMSHVRFVVDSDDDGMGSMNSSSDSAHNCSQPSECSHCKGTLNNSSPKQQTRQKRNSGGSRGRGSKDSLAARRHSAPYQKYSDHDRGLLRTNDEHTHSVHRHRGRGGRPDTDSPRTTRRSAPGSPRAAARSAGGSSWPRHEQSSQVAYNRTASGSSEEGSVHRQNTRDHYSRKNTSTRGKGAHNNHRSPVSQRKPNTKNITNIDHKKQQYVMEKQFANFLITDNEESESDTLNAKSEQVTNTSIAVHGGNPKWNWKHKK